MSLRLPGKCVGGVHIFQGHLPASPNVFQENISVFDKLGPSVGISFVPLPPRFAFHHDPWERGRERGRRQLQHLQDCTVDVRNIQTLFSCGGVRPPSPITKLSNGWAPWRRYLKFKPHQSPILCGAFNFVWGDGVHMWVVYRTGVWIFRPSTEKTKRTGNMKKQTYRTYIEWVSEWVSE